MKKITLAALLLLSISSISIAQRIRKVEGNPAEIAAVVK
jgi:hypothetical protein